MYSYTDAPNRFSCSAALAIGVGLVISTLARTQQQAILGVFLLMSPATVLSGFTTPIANMPDWCQALTLVNPLRYMMALSRYNLQSPVSLIRMMIQQSNCFIVVERGQGLGARWCGVDVEACSIGFGREIVGWNDRHGTRWKFSLVPLGGYVKMFGDRNAASVPDNAAVAAMTPAERKVAFAEKSVGQRAAIVAAGPAINFLFAILIIATFAFVHGESRTPAVAGVVEQGSAADAAGIQVGDRILSFNGRAMDTYTDMVMYTRIRPGEPVDVVIDRGGKRLEIQTRIGAVMEDDGFGQQYRVGRLGIGASDPVVERVGLLRAPVVAIARNFPDFTCGRAEGMLSNINWT